MRHPESQSQRTVHQGERFACLRVCLGLSRADAAGLLGVSFETVRDWETGRRAIPEGAWLDALVLRDDHDAEVQHHLEAFRSTEVAPVLLLETDDQARPLGWQRAVAAAVLREVPEVQIVRAAS